MRDLTDHHLTQKDYDELHLSLSQITSHQLSSLLLNSSSHVNQHIYSDNEGLIHLDNIINHANHFQNDNLEIQMQPLLTSDPSNPNEFLSHAIFAPQMQYQQQMQMQPAYMSLHQATINNMDNDNQTHLLHNMHQFMASSSQLSVSDLSDSSIKRSRRRDATMPGAVRTTVLEKNKEAQRRYRDSLTDEKRIGN